MLGLASSLANAAEVAASDGQTEVTARLLGAAEALRRRERVAVDPFNLDDPHPLIARVQAELGEAAFAAAWTQGQTLLLEQAITEADAVLAEAVRADRHGRSDT